MVPAPRPATPSRSRPSSTSSRRRSRPHTLNSYHPRALSYFTPPPLVASIVGEVLAQWTNQGIDVWHAGPVGAFVEEEVIRWLCDLVGYGEGSFGLLASGGVMANFIAMALVRDVHLRELRGASRPPRGAALEGVRVYTGDQTHFSIARALDELGFPPETLVTLPADDRFRLHAEPVAEAIAADRARGLLPVAVCAVAGSTNTGSVDLVEDLAALARREGLWFHVDAAYGGAALLSERDAARVPGLALADSVTVDPHKWFFQAYDIGALLVRDGGHLRQTFDRSPEYYRGGESPAGEGDASHEDAHAGQLNFYKLGFEGTRRFRALKLWATWKHLGTSGLGRLVEANDDIAAYLAQLCADADDLEALPAEPELSVVCFRHLPGGAAAASAMDATRARRPPGPARGRARGVRRRLAVDDEPPGRHVAAGRCRELPHDEGRHRPAARDAPAARRRLSGRAGRLSSRRRTSRSRCAAAGRRARAPGSRRAAGRAATGTPRDRPRRSRRRAPLRGRP